MANRRHFLLSLGAALTLSAGCSRDDSDMGRLAQRHSHEQDRLFGQQGKERFSLTKQHEGEIVPFLPKDVYAQIVKTHQDERSTLQQRHLKEREELFSRQHTEVMGALRVFTEPPSSGDIGSDGR